MNLQALTKNKTVLYTGAAVVAGALIFVVMKVRGSSRSSTGASSGDAATPGATVVGGFPDTSGTDIASWLGNYETGLNSQIGELQREMGDIQRALGNLQPTNGTGTGGTTPPIRVPIVRPAPYSGPQPVAVGSVRSSYPLHTAIFPIRQPT